MRNYRNICAWESGVMPDENLKSTPLSKLWEDLGARMVLFAGYNMPVQYKDGVIKEHLWTRENAGLFDVSHMGPCYYALKDRDGLSPDEAHIQIAKIVEQVLPCDVQGLKPGQIRYSMLLNKEGGIIDDLMVARPLIEKDQGSLYIVVNAGGKEKDFEIFEEIGKDKAILIRKDFGGLIALQGPKAKNVISKIADGAQNLGFMNAGAFDGPFGRLLVTRSGYTGEDGFEILLENDICLEVVEFLLADDRVKPIGLGARDSLRLEAGLCLYGHDLDESISPIEAGLSWTIQKCRRENADFNGATRILSEITNKPSRKRIGILPYDKAPAREGTIIKKDGVEIGVITSGGFSPSLNAPIAMGYVQTQFAEVGTEIELIVRDKARPAKIAPMPFVPHQYYKK